MKAIFYIVTIVVVLHFSATHATSAHYLEQGDIFHFEPNYGSRNLQILCHQGKPKYIIHIWRSVMMQIHHPTDDYSQFDGGTPEDVKKQYMDKQYSWSINPFSVRTKNIKLNPFNTSCIGIESKDKYSVHLKVLVIDFWKVCAMAFGAFLFLSSDRLSRNTLFHYLCGISFGICASCLIVIYFVSKILPRKTLMFGAIGAGWTIVIYFLQMLWDHINVIMSTYQAHVVWYMVVTGTISFIVCYRWGPVTSPRTINLIKWSLQLIGLVTIFFSSYYQEAAMGQIVLLLLIAYFPKRWVRALQRFWKRKFPPKVKPLSNDEYYEQGVRETAKALEDLRQYCSSPECNQWNTALRLKDVKRFASFIEGNSHLSDQEILEYETSINGELTDDDDLTEDEGC